jgi:Cu/Zn superoxide dismutase
MYGLDKSNVRGIVFLEKTSTDTTTMITLNVSGLDPGNYSVVIGTYGDTLDGIDPSFPFNPFNVDHGCCPKNECNPNTIRPVGIIGDFEISVSTGFERVAFSNNNPNLLFETGTSVIGRELIIYQGHCSSDPLTQKALSRGVIGIANMDGNAATHPNPVESYNTNSVAAVLKTTKNRATPAIIGEILVGPDDSGIIDLFADVIGLKLNGNHSIRIHTYGDLSDWDGFDEDQGQRTGTDYDPRNTNHHALPYEASVRHSGDLGNMLSDSTGYANFFSKEDLLSITGPESIVGRAFVIYSDEDKGQAQQPDGAPGNVWGVGVFGLSLRSFPTTAPTPGSPAPTPIPTNSNDGSGTPWYDKPGYELLLAAIVLFLGVCIIAYVQRLRKQRAFQHTAESTSTVASNKTSLLSVQGANVTNKGVRDRALSL